MTAYKRVTFGGATLEQSSVPELWRLWPTINADAPINALYEDEILAAAAYIRKDMRRRKALAKKETAHA